MLSDKRLSCLPHDQQALLDTWLPGAAVVADHSWALGQRHVLQVSHRDALYAVKAGVDGDHHMSREIRAHRDWLTPWTSRGRAPLMVHADLDARLLVTRWLPGTLLEPTPAVEDPETFRQAGALLASLHAQAGVEDPDHERRETARALAYLDSSHRISTGTCRRLRTELDSWDLEVISTLVPTHGDWQPRNWLLHEGTVSVIDFGRAGLRTAMSDLARLAAQDFRRDPRIESAFFEGYGDDPRREHEGALSGCNLWRRLQVREAIGTAVWAFQVGDEAFEAQGHRMIAEVLESHPD